MALGIDITERTIRVLASPRKGHEGEAGKANRAEVQWDGGASEPAALKEGLREAVGTLHPSDGKAAVAIPSGWCHYRTVRFPFRSPDRIENTFRYALEDRLPGEIEAFSIVPLSGIREQGDSGASLFTAACLTSRVQQVRSALQDLDLEPALIQPGCAALAWHVGQSTAGNDGRPDPAWFFRDTGNSYELCLIDGGELEACLTVPADSPEGEVDHQASAEALNVALRSQALERTGDAACAPLLAVDGKAGLPEEMVQHLCTSVVERNGTDDMDRWSVAASAAAQAETSRESPVDLTASAETSQSLGGGLDKKLGTLLGLVAVILLMVNVYYGRQVLSGRQQLNELASRREQVLGRVDAGVSSIYALEAKVKEMKQSAQAARDTAHISCLRCWRDLMKQVPDKIDASFNLIDIDQSRVKLQVSTPEAAQAVSLRKKLSSASAFSMMSGSNISDRPDGGVKLEMELQYNG